jgi:hypothetical protein
VQLENADAPDFERVAAFAFERVDIALRTCLLDSENAHFDAAFRAAQQGFDWLVFLGHRRMLRPCGRNSQRGIPRAGVLPNSPFDRRRPVRAHFGAFLAAAGAAAARLQIVEQKIVRKFRDRPFRIVMAEGGKVRAIDQDMGQRLRAAIGDARVTRLIVHERMPLVP